MPLVATRGAASAQGFGEFAVTSTPTYIEDVFSTYLYTGNGSTQTITNNIDITGKGALVWIKQRNSTGYHILTDTARGAGLNLSSNVTIAQYNDGQPTFNNNGFNLINSNADYNGNGSTYASWTFRKQPKFFDVVTYTGNGTAGTTISHNLGSTPGCIFIKKISSASTTGWPVYHRSATDTFFLNKNDNQGGLVSNVVYSPTDTTFTVSSYTDANASGETYVAYLFAHDSGGFGLNGTDNVISCGGFTTDGSGNATVSLGYEPQFIIVKSRGTNGDWRIFDVMRGMPVGNTNVARLVANATGAETLTTDFNVSPTSTGFIGKFSTSTNATYVYIAIRRGPMKVPTSGTSVFNAITRTGTGAAATITGIGFAPDLVYPMCRNDIANKGGWVDKLRGASANLTTNLTDAESTNTQGVTAFGNTSISVGTSSFFNSALNYVNYFFVRAPSFFDEVCYTTDGTTNQRITHNLAAVPELIITRRRDGAGNWFTYSATLGRSGYVSLNLTNANFTGFTDVWGTTNPTTTDFGYNCQILTNSPYTDRTIVAYLFATCAGVSKVGSYTGTGATQTIDCGFGAGGSRFVLIKRTDTTGDWYVWDSARGMTSGTDPSLLLNSTAAEVNANSVYAISTGFQIVSTAAGINASAGTYIFLSVA